MPPQAKKCKSCKVENASASAGPKAMKASPGMKLAEGEFVLLNGGSGTFTTLGTNEAGQKVDISDVATETVESDDPNLTVDEPQGMAVTLHAPGQGAGTANVTFTATWNDASVGPYTFTARVSYSGGQITGITVIQN